MGILLFTDRACAEGKLPLAGLKTVANKIRGE